MGAIHWILLSLRFIRCNNCNIVICLVVFLRVPGTGGARECPLFSLNIYTVSLLCMIPGTNSSLLTCICNSAINPDGAFRVICRSGQSTENCAHSQLWLYCSLSLFPLDTLTEAALVKKGLLWLMFKAPWQESQGIRSPRQLPSHFRSQEGESNGCIQAAPSPFSTYWKEDPIQEAAPPTGIPRGSHPRSLLNSVKLIIPAINTFSAFLFQLSND